MTRCDWCTRTATLRPGLGSQGDLPVDPGGPAPGVALRHLPHADQRVGPASQHQLLQVPDLRPVLLLRRLEDPLPQPPYLLLTARQSIASHSAGASSGPVLRSVHLIQRHREREPCPVIAPNLPFGSSGYRLLRLQRLTCPRQRAFAPGHQARYPASYTRRPAEEPAMLSRFPAAFRQPAFASWASCPAREFGPPYGRPTSAAAAAPGP